MKIGITGQQGFVGTHLWNTLGLQEGVERIPFERSFFDSPNQLQDFVSECDAIVHLAAMNRHPDPQVIYDTNVGLVERLITACRETGAKPHILFSSSTQESRDNLYGQSKKEGKEKLAQWAASSGGTVTSLTIPNVFGPFGKPEYNSVVATFCHKIARGETPTIIQDNEIGLIYINELVAEILGVVKGERKTKALGPNAWEYPIEPPHHRKVSEILELLLSYREGYLEKGVFPDLTDPFGKALFNTFRCYIPESHYPVKFTKHTDPRGSFVEITRALTPGQFSFSTTVPGITRGNHFHTRKAERFAVIQGKARIQLRKIGTEEVINYDLNGEDPAYVDMPIWYTHNITNTGDGELITLFWINEPYDAADPDTYFEDVTL
jgi:UDP-2-acetamido-2,6-beta-L-arabino-hexul-4-ose reductase